MLSMLVSTHAAPHFPCMAPEATIAKFRGKYKKGWDELSLARHQRQVESGLIRASWKPQARPESGIKGRCNGNDPGGPDSNVFIGQCWAHLNNTPFRLYKHYNHEGGIASPLIAHWPAALGDRSDKSPWIDTPTHLIDLMATCIDVGAAQYPSEFKGNKITPLHGQSLTPLLNGKGAFPLRSLYWEHEGNAAVRAGDQKLVRKGLQGDWELYDLKSDRTEQFNLAKENPTRVAQLQSQWNSWAKAANVHPKPGEETRKGNRAQNDK